MTTLALALFQLAAHDVDVAGGDTQRLVWGRSGPRRRRRQRPPKSLLGNIIPAFLPVLDDRTIGAATRAARVFSADSNTSWTERAVLATYALAAVDGRVWTLTEDDVAQRAGLTARTVRNVNESLSLKGLISTSMVSRGKPLPDGTYALRNRVVITLTELPDVAVHGLRGALAHAFNPMLHLSATLRVILAVYLRHESAAGWSFPGYDLVALATGLSRRTVIDGVRRLIELGHMHPEYTRGGPTRYRLTPRFSHVGKGPLSTGNGPHAKEITEGDSSRAAATEASNLQLALPFAFNGVRSARTAAIQAVLEMHEAICKAPAGPDAVKIIEERMGEGMLHDDFAAAFQGAELLQWRRERLERRTVASLLQTKAKGLSFIGRVNPERAQELELRPIAKTKAPDTTSGTSDFVNGKPTPAFAQKLMESAAKIAALPRPSWA